MTSIEVAQLDNYNRLVTQELLALRARTRFCNDGLNEVISQLNLPMLTAPPDSDDMVEVHVHGIVRVESHRAAQLHGNATNVYLTNIIVEPAVEPVALADINQKLKAIVERKARIRAYALKRVMADEIGSMDLADVNGFLAALGIPPLALKKYLFDVPVAEKIRYEVLAESEADARVGLSAQIKEDVDANYLEHGDLEDALPSPTARRVLVSTEDAE